MDNKLKYEEAELEVVLLDSSDVITTSNLFDGEDDYVSEWGN